MRVTYLRAATNRQSTQIGLIRKKSNCVSAPVHCEQMSASSMWRLTDWLTDWIEQQQQQQEHPFVSSFQTRPSSADEVTDTVKAAARVNEQLREKKRTQTAGLVINWKAGTREEQGERERERERERATEEKKASEGTQEWAPKARVHGDGSRSGGSSSSGSNSSGRMNRSN